MRPTYIAVYIFIIIFPLAVHSADWTSFCGNDQCFCKWQQGKKSALCSSRGLTTIPQNLSTELQVLVLNDNNISYLNREEFASNLHLLNLQKIYLKQSKIKHVHREAFKNLKILIEIDLSENEIETIDKQTFAGNERLRILSLYGNPIKHLNQFPLLKFLRTLDLRNCQIAKIDATVFSNLDLLEYLDLKKNLLENLPHNIFSHMKNLKTLFLEDNPWNCDCRLKKFKNWYSTMTFKPLKCETGRFKGQFWHNVDSFGCAPELELYEENEYTSDDIGPNWIIGSNISYRCLAKGDPVPVLQWDFNGKQLDSDNIIIDVENIGEDRLWSNLTIFNISSMDSGIYRCSAKSSFGFVSKNVSLILPEMVENIIIRSHPETFWYFGLILGIFSTIFCFIIFSILYCVLIKIVRNRNRRNIKSSVSFNDQEKKLLDLSITTNERQDFSEINTPSTSTNKTDSIVISLEPSQSHNRDEFPLNVGVFSPSQATYGNIFISVSVTQDAIDNLNDSMYPDLLNMPNRSTKGSFIPIMPRKDLKATTTLENVELNTSSESTLFSSPNFQSFDENYKHPQLNESLQAKSICEACKANENRFLSENNEYFLRECENKYLCLKYDNMGRRVTADGSHSILSLSEDEQMQEEVIYKRDTIISNNKDIPPTSANDFVSL